MIKLLCILILLTLQSTSSHACLNTYQFKVFPVGVSGENIVSVDVQIRRTSESEGNRWLNLQMENAGEVREMWILDAFISTYDKTQKLLAFSELGSTYSIGSSYSDSLNKLYQRGLAIIATEFSDIDYFKPEYLSFCDFQHHCLRVSIECDTLSNSNYIVFDGKRYPASMLRDTSNFGFGQNYDISGPITGLYINSIRVYKSNSLSIVITHLAKGHEISMGWITSDPKEAEKDDAVTLAKEYPANFSYTDIHTSTYVEPLLHHGYGIDVFIVR